MSKTNTTNTTLEALEIRIANLEKIVRQQNSIINDLVGTLRANTSRSATPVESKDSKASSVVAVGNLLFDGKIVYTGTGFMSSKARYAIGKTITENFGGVKLTKGNKTFDTLHKADKYVQVYEFKTKADCKKFMEDQKKRVG